MVKWEQENSKRLGHMKPVLIKWEYEGDFKQKIDDISSETVSEFIPKARVITGCTAIDSNNELSSLISTMY